MRIPEGEAREKGKEEIFEIIMTENFPKWMSDIKPQIQEVQRTPSRINVKKPNQPNKKTTPTAYHFQTTENQR